MCWLFSTGGGIHSTSISRGWANDRDRVPQRGEQPTLRLLMGNVFQFLRTAKTWLIALMSTFDSKGLCRYAWGRTGWSPSKASASL